MDREAIARRRRRRQVEEALDEERTREAALAEQLEEVVAEIESSRIDELAFARMQPEDVAVVRETLAAPQLFEDEDDDLRSAEDVALERADVDEEIARLQHEIADSQRRQLAFGRYLEALDALGERRG